jgi:hypothetical protein
VGLARGYDVRLRVVLRLAVPEKADHAIGLPASLYIGVPGGNVRYCRDSGAGGGPGVLLLLAGVLPGLAAAGRGDNGLSGVGGIGPGKVHSRWC